MAALPDDMSPLQIGSGGYFEEQPFALIGRLKIGWRDGLWNEWHLLMADGRRGWIGEAQGSFSISFELQSALPRDVEVTLNHCHALLTGGKPATEARPGFMVQLGGATLRAVDIKLATCLGSEGELPFTAPKGRRTVAIDCIGKDGEFATLDHDGHEARAYVGRYVEWDAFRFTNLRPLEGW
ncbi:DUF4178 domain-containing protein [Mesorhizobium sp. ESP-6-4]|uniref:DUF4178 domain-containing protein n=1 Tax=Mesorhizobium sp. ESP-6-4 TaxID=2876624 RepID=UPI001CCB1D3E|nr:DUF4178 domain-containing protein [Mesorhizobium sp. ESP-6-4]MBZ9657433.1 DUF4178 domain-containing protein [Mesorhizobium sp. ESP-6-4]